MSNRAASAESTPGSDPRPKRLAWILTPGFMTYAEANQRQSLLVGLRREGKIPDTLVLLEHPPVITLGRRGNTANVLAPPQVLRRLGIAVEQTDRGGDVTYHGPGQLVGYPIVDLRGYRQDVRGYVHSLEEVMIAVLGEYGVAAARRPGYPGVWAAAPQIDPSLAPGERGSHVHAPVKLGFIGVHVSRWVTHHGFSLNVQPNLSHFDLICPCGLQGVRVSSLAEMLGHEVDFHAVQARTAAAFARVFGCEPQPVEDGAIEAAGAE